MDDSSSQTENSFRPSRLTSFNVSPLKSINLSRQIQEKIPFQIKESVFCETQKNPEELEEQKDIAKPEQEDVDSLVRYVTNDRVSEQPHMRSISLS